LTEQYVCQQLNNKIDIYYWTAANATSEIDVVLQQSNEIIPVEVKAEENLKAKSLKVFVERYQTIIYKKMDSNIEVDFY
jgi:predicted AAA+ superfamily ATPase